MPICRVCDSRHLVLFLDLGMHPWCNDFLTKERVGQEPKYPLRVVWCSDCGTVQLDHTVPKEIMFGDHTYLSGITRSLSDHFKKVAELSLQQVSRPPDRCNVLDIGSNDGTQLRHYIDHGCDVLGVESSKTTAEIAIKNEIPTLNRFFNYDLTIEMAQSFDIINAAGVFFHLEELHSVAKGIKNALKDDGVFCIQFLYMKKIVENIAFDQIYHEHLLFYNLKTLSTLLTRHGLELYHAELAPIHGGTIIAFASHEGSRERTGDLIELLNEEEESGCNTLEYYQIFAEKVEQLKVKNQSFLRSAKEAGKRIYGFGAPVKGNTLLNYFEQGTDIFDCLVEKNQLRKGLYAPGSHIPVIMEDEISTLPDIYYVLAWNFKAEILANNKELLERGIEFYFPIDAGDCR